MRALECPDFAPDLCAQVEIADHVRTQRFAGMRWTPSATVGLGKGLQVSFALPLEIKRFTIDHTLRDGAQYTIPYTILTGPSETVGGLGDARLTMRAADRIPDRPLILDVALGFALPTGKSSRNPFAPGVPPSQRQHRQFGNGTFDPVIELGLVVTTRPVGLIVGGAARLPLYFNTLGYRGQLLVSGSAGVMVAPPAPLDRVRLLLLGEATHAGPASWEGEAAPNSGRDSLGIRAGLEWMLSPQIVVRGSFAVPFVERLTGEQFISPMSLGLGVSGLVDLRPRSKRDHHAQRSTTSAAGARRL